MSRQLEQSVRASVFAMDVILGAVAFVGVLALTGRGSATFLSQPDSLKLTVLALVASLALPSALYATLDRGTTRRADIATLAARLVTAGLLSALAVAGVAFAIRGPVAPGVLALCVATQFAAICLYRISVFALLRVARRRGRDTRNILIVGSGPRARHVQRMIERNPEWGYRVSGFLDEQDHPLDPEIPPEQVHKVVELPRLLRDCSVDEVIAACPRSVFASLGPIVSTCSVAGVPVTILSDIFGDYVPPPRITRFGTLAALRVKRAIDIVGSGILLMLTAPIVAVAAAAIAATSPGPIFFRQVRCGRNGHRFRMLKLRTMVVDAEARQSGLTDRNEMTGPVFKIQEDPRVTPVGRILRRWSIDELPQLWNVFRGDMSLVGPRPPIPSEVDQYRTEERRRLSMRPGITCLWQVSGRNRIGFDDWVRLDIQYIDTWSLTRDVKILLRTIPVVLRGTGV